MIYLPGLWTYRDKNNRHRFLRAAYEQAAGGASRRAMRFVQLNLNHSEAAQDFFGRLYEKRESGIAILCV